MKSYGKSLFNRTSNLAQNNAPIIAGAVCATIGAKYCRTPDIFILACLGSGLVALATELFATKDDDQTLIGRPIKQYMLITALSLLGLAIGAYSAEGNDLKNKTPQPSVRMHSTITKPLYPITCIIKPLPTSQRDLV